MNITKPIACAVVVAAGAFLTPMSAIADQQIGLSVPGPADEVPADLATNAAAQTDDVTVADDAASSARLAIQQSAYIAAQVVELRSADGFVSIVGTIVSYDESLITVNSNYGVVGLETRDVTCFGAACPPELTAAQ